MDTRSSSFVGIEGLSGTFNAVCAELSGFNICLEGAGTLKKAMIPVAIRSHPSVVKVPE
ncbi:hypothetical protein D3C78_1182060 [compost metagenome]